MDKRINILFDHLNNEELLKPDTVGQMVEISRAVASKEWDRAQALFTEMQSAKLDTEGTLWMVSRNIFNLSNIHTNLNANYSIAGRCQASYCYW